MFLLLDNYDSFTYNAFHLLAGRQHRGQPLNITVRRNDELTVAEAMAVGDEGIIISPGPCTPKEAGISLALVEACVESGRPLFGICLGLQTMVEALGGTVAPYSPPLHGKVSTIMCDNQHWLFRDLPPRFQATRYHSLAVTAMPPQLVATATSMEDEQVMAVAHRHLPLAGVQFHPESHYSQFGKELVDNFLDFASQKVVRKATPPVVNTAAKSNNKIVTIEGSAVSDIKAVIEKLRRKEDLSDAEMTMVFNQMMAGEMAVPDMVDFLRALTVKGETVVEITAAARTMRARAAKVAAPPLAEVIDVVGTGGDMKGTLNISTTTAFILAGLGVHVAKHGNRAITSQSGTADVQQELGIDIDYSLARVEQSLRDVGFAFLFAPKHHAAARFVAPARKLLAEEKIRTIFNILGPLTNPAMAPFYLLGVYDKKWLWPLATVLKNLGAKRAWVVHGSDGLDEISIAASSWVVKLEDGKLTETEISPRDAGLPLHPLSSITGGSPAENAKAIIDLLSARPSDNPARDAGFRDAVLLNSAAALVIIGIAPDLVEGVRLARQSITSGRALVKLRDFALFTTDGKSFGKYLG
ncbi:MAG: anthranilate phosphoribosyltransferase [Alphaproteobacteria bacterium]|nr:anthranilate phosphoribosyltransferase [Alphaproteobacteria bacterium]